MIFAKMFENKKKKTFRGLALFFKWFEPGLKALNCNVRVQLKYIQLLR